MKVISALREIRAQIVYAGAGLGGKTTNLEYLQSQYGRGRLSGVNTEGERTLLFDLLSVDYPVLDGWALRFNLVTVPGQAQYRESRRLALKSPDAIVFVADSSPSRQEANRFAIDDVQRVLLDLKQDPAEIPLVMQYNKRDLPDAVTIAEMEEALNPGRAPAVVASALRGVGVFRTLGVAMDLVKSQIETQLAVN